MKRRKPPRTRTSRLLGAPVKWTWAAIWLSAWLCCLCLNTSTTPALASDQIKVGDMFPQIDLPLWKSKMKGQLASSSTKRNKIILVDFWASWCGPCQLSFPYLDKIAAQNKENIEVIGINVDNELEAAENFLKEHPVSTIKIALDSKNTFAKKVGVTTMPSSYLIDTKGKVQWIHQGFEVKDQPEFEAQIKKMISNKKVK